jgi:putative photosynthetic complex assembly protein
MSEHHDHRFQVPRGALIGAAVLIGLTIAAVGAMRIAGIEPTARVPEPESAIASKALRFEDRPDGAVVIVEADRDGRERIVRILEPGGGGFVRGVLRSLARERRAQGVGPEQPFVLTLQANGELFLEDASTDQRIYLQAFGPSNVESFRSLLVGGPNPETSAP